MLKVSIKLKINNKEKILKLRSIEAGTLGGSMTDYGISGTRILHFLHPSEGKGSLELSYKGGSIEQGLIRATFPFGKLNIIKILKLNEIFEYPFKSKYGDAKLVLELTI